ncbi:hypothetical protein HOLleu_37665 [Holothuria leucospilota]|uniref:Uncharacterized protein n=1 Tax=Holothuria leucospilota TaxID=206669 RepID=A0A9Q0YP65_HOLLE|nr:hypothetical protein HOLleu_37665 [Holothuria leucospilota]
MGSHVVESLGRKLRLAPSNQSEEEVAPCPFFLRLCTWHYSCNKVFNLNNDYIRKQQGELTPAELRLIVLAVDEFTCDKKKTLVNDSTVTHLHLGIQTCIETFLRLSFPITARFTAIIPTTGVGSCSTAAEQFTSSF